MAERNVTSLYADAAKRLRTSGPDARVIDAIQLLSGGLDRHLRTAPIGASFAKAWLLQRLATEILRYSIEDDYVSLDPVRDSAAALFQELLAEDDWLDARVVKVLSVCRALAVAQPLRARLAEVHLEESDCRIVGRVAESLDEPIAVSSRRYPLVPVLEDSFAHPDYVSGILEAFARRVDELRHRHEATLLCFIEKAAGPVGAISMLAPLAMRLGLPTCIYRSDYWATRAKISAHAPRKNDRIVMVYDLVVTGDGIAQAAADITDRYKARVVAAAVLFGFERQKNEGRMMKQHQLDIQALGWYGPIESEVRRIVCNETEQTEHIRVLPTNRSSATSPVRGRVRLPPLNGDTKMETRPQWKGRLFQYPHVELRGLTFASEKDLDEALRRMWDPQNPLYGVPRDIPEGGTVIVPVAALPFLNGIKYEIEAVVSMSSLSDEERQNLRRGRRS